MRVFLFIRDIQFTMEKQKMKNGFDVELSIRSACYRNGFHMVAMQYSLRDQYAVFIAEPFADEGDRKQYSTHMFSFETKEIGNGQYYLSKEQAKKSLYQRFDDMQGGAQ